MRELIRVDKLAEPIRVYNLEVQGQHVYQVSSLGMLVHNASPKNVDIRNLVPHPGGKQFADPHKLARLGKFDWAKYRPIEVMRDPNSGVTYIMRGMTRVEAAMRDKIYILPAIFQ
ncbi:MAG: hypothetical protein H6823_08890 [Planctomycetaceae bacterium]|nr:hypothetical protein [Planctomycetaceae bacterium]